MKLQANQKLIMLLGIVWGVVTVSLFLTTEPYVISEAVTDSDGKAVTFSWTAFWTMVSIIYVAFSFRWWSYTVVDTDGTLKKEKGFIDADQIGVVKLFGRPIQQIQSGLPFVPLGICELVKLPIVVQQKEFPAEPRDIYRGDMKDKSELPENMQPPFRLNFRNSVKDDDAKRLLGSEYTITDVHGVDISFNASAPKDGLSKRVTAEIVPVIRWRIKNGINFITNIGSLTEANRQIEDELFSVLVRVLPNMSVGQALQNFKWINAILRRAAIARTGDWGVEIEGAFLKMIPLHHELNDAIALAAEAEFRGRGEREMIQQRGAGNAKAAHDLEKETLKGRTAGLVTLAEELNIEGDEAIAQFVATQLASSEGTIIFGADGLGQLAGVGAALMKRNGQNTDQQSTSGG